MDEVPKITLIAGMPRSGSTWTFNAARLLLEQTGRSVHAAWVGDYDPDNPADLHLVKAHSPEDVRFRPDRIMTSWRPYAECIASQIRMGWLSPSPDSIRASHDKLKKLYEHWAPYSAMEVAHRDIVTRPEFAVESIAAALNLPRNAPFHAHAAAQLAALQAPSNGAYDKTTLMHPRHRKTAEDPAPLGLAEIEAILNEPSVS